MKTSSRSEPSAATVRSAPDIVIGAPAFGPPVPAVIYDAIRKAIVDGVYQPGESIRQEALARKFSVSRVPIREALSRLEADGLIVLRPRRGYVTKELDAAEIAEIFEMRAVMEEHAAAAATRVRTASDVAAVEALLHELEATAKRVPADPQRWVELNRDFHNRIFATSGRRHLCQAINNYRAWVDGYIRVEIDMTGRLVQAHRDHRQILRAFKKGDAEACGRLSREHCLHTSERLLQALEKRTTAR